MLSFLRSGLPCCCQAVTADLTVQDMDIGMDEVSCARRDLEVVDIVAFSSLEPPGPLQAFSTADSSRQVQELEAIPETAETHLAAVQELEASELRQSSPAVVEPAGHLISPGTAPFPSARLGRRRQRDGQSDAGRQETDEALAPRAYEANFARATAVSALIGYRDDYEQVTRETGTAIAAGIRKEWQLMKDEIAQLRREGREEEAKTLEKHCETGKADLLKFLDLCETVRPEKLASHCMNLYTKESWLYTMINACERDRDTSHTGLAPFCRILHDTLRKPPHGFRRWTGNCYRWIKMPESLLDQFRITTAYRLSNLIAFPGFTSACKDEYATWENLATFRGSNVLLVICQDDGQGPIDISVQSDYPGEAEVLYPLGQQFEMVERREVEFSGLKAILGEEGAFDDGPKVVVKMIAVDVFYDFAQDFFRGGGTAWDAVPILQKRLNWEKQNRPEWEPICMRFIGMAQREAGDFQGALDTFARAKQHHIEKKTTRQSEFAALMRELGIVLQTMGHFQAGLDAYQKAKAIYEDVDLLNTPNGGALMQSMGTCRDDLNDYTGALHDFEEARAIYRDQGLMSAPHGAALLTSIGNTRSMQNNLDGALESYVEAKRIYAACCCLHTPNCSSLITSIGMIKVKKNDLEGAMAEYEEAKQILMAANNLESSHGGTMYVCMAVVKEMQGDRAAAEDLFQLAIRSYEKLQSLDCYNARAALAGLARVRSAPRGGVTTSSDKQDPEWC